MAPATKANRLDPRLLEGPKISLEELMSLVRHGKFALVKEALDYLPNKRFDKGLVLPVSLGCPPSVHPRIESFGPHFYLMLRKGTAQNCCHFDVCRSVIFLEWAQRM